MSICTKNKSILTANERKELIYKSLHGYEIEQKELINVLRNYEKKKVELEKLNFIKSELESYSGSYFVPVAGSINGEQWNKHIESIWTNTDDIIVHTVLFPKDRSSVDTCFYNAKVAETKKYQLDAGVIPTTVTNPSKTVEVYAESNTIPKTSKLPNHFVVVDTKELGNLDRDLLVEKYNRRLNKQK